MSKKSNILFSRNSAAFFSDKTLHNYAWGRCLSCRKNAGTSKGELLKLIQLVSRKFQRGKSPEAIAEELEEDSALISKICAAIQQCVVDADEAQIYDAFQNMDS